MNNAIISHINNAIQSLEEAIRFTITRNSKSSVEQLLIEVKWINCLQDLIDVINFHILKNFSLKLKLDCDDTDNCHQSLST